MPLRRRDLAVKDISIVSVHKWVDVELAQQPLREANGAIVDGAGRGLAASLPPLTLVDDVEVKLEDGSISMLPRSDTKRARSMWGMSRTMVANLMQGVTDGFTKTLEIQGVGYRAQMKGKDTLQLNLGFSHEVLHKVPSGIDVTVGGNKQEIITVTGIDKQQVGQIAASIRKLRPPEPYQGKGIRYADEQVQRKVGKAFASGGA